MSLKHTLTNAPVLAMPVDGGGFVLDADVNQSSIGCVLQQMQNWLQEVIGYANKAFSEAELRYCTTRRELVAHARSEILPSFPAWISVRYAYWPCCALSRLLRTPNPVAQHVILIHSLSISLRCNIDLDCLIRMQTQ